MECESFVDTLGGKSKMNILLGFHLVIMKHEVFIEFFLKHPMTHKMFVGFYFWDEIGDKFFGAFAKGHGE